MTISLTPVTAPAVAARSWSPYQEGIFDAIVHGLGNIVVEAVAGSGKTTTIIEAIRRWLVGHPGGRVAFLAFNKSIADELSRKVPSGVVAKTMHSVCFGAVLRKFKGIKVDDQKLLHWCAKVALEQGLVGEEADDVVADLRRAYGLIKSTLTSVHDMGAMAAVLDTHGVELEDTRSLSLVANLDLLMRSDKYAVTFDEMLSFVLDHNISLPKFDLLCVDEAQDMNRMQIEIMKRLLSKEGRLVAVGDTFQSIYGFRGADAEAMNRIRAEFNVSKGNQLPLSITYRCAQSVVAMAQTWVPHIQASPSADVGETITLDKFENGNGQKVFDSLQSGDMVVCRVNAPLVAGALKLLAQGRKAIVRGRDIGKNLTTLTNKLSKKLLDSDVSGLFQRVDEWMKAESIKMRVLKKETQAQQVEDRGETLLAVMRGARTITECKNRIEMLFSDDSVGVVFSSIHKSKGLEAPTVVWFGPEKCDEFIERARSKDAERQELNLAYVATTRAITRLIRLPLPERGENIRQHDDGNVDPDMEVQERWVGGKTPRKVEKEH